MPILLGNQELTEFCIDIAIITGFYMMFIVFLLLARVKEKGHNQIYLYEAPHFVL